MPFDTLTAAAVADELQTVVTGGQIQRIIQPSNWAVALGIYRHGAQHWVLLSADPSHARIHLATQRLAKAYATPSSFVMLLRKHLEGRHVLDVKQEQGERIVSLWCSESSIRLTAEVMGKHSNVILIDDQNSILGSLKIIGPKQSRVRPIMPGRSYALPPSPMRDASIYPEGQKIDPCEHPGEFLGLMGAADRNVSLRSALQGLLAGASPFLVGQIVLAAGYDPDRPLDRCEPTVLANAASRFYELYRTRAWNPCTFTIASERMDFAPYLPAGVSDLREEPSISAAIEASSAASETHDVLGPIRSSLLSDLERMANATDRKISSLKDGLNASADAARVMEMGQLVLAYQYAAVPGARQLEVPDMDITIPLDPLLSTQKNAEKLFRRYHKLRDAQERLPELMRQAETRKAELEDHIAFTRLASSETELAALRREIEGRREPSKPSRGNAERRRGPARFSLSGYRATVGRSARENEEVTFRLASRDDLWLHARERTGAHVVLHTADGAPSEEIVEAAAQLAAYFSEGRSDTRVDVDSTRVRNVRKIPGGPPGRVTYSEVRTIRVQPTLSGWVRDGN